MNIQILPDLFHKHSYSYFSRESPQTFDNSNPERKKLA